MWVKGDLKDQLGIGHHKGKKGAKRTSVSVRLKIPLPPMFDKDHNRSASEFSQHNYEPALSSSPGTNTSMGRQTCLHMPPLDGIAEEMTPAQYAYARSRSRADDLAPPSAPGDGPSRASYYESASETPLPLPLPSPKYKYSDGTVTSTPPSRRSSVVTIRTFPHTRHNRDHHHNHCRCQELLAN